MSIYFETSIFKLFAAFGLFELHVFFKLYITYEHKMLSGRIWIWIYGK